MIACFAHFADCSLHSNIFFMCLYAESDLMLLKRTNELKQNFISTKIKILLKQK